jgi:uncharacterized protein YndB with AHSA1/START domain
MSGFVITRSLRVQPERVWSAFTTADEYAAWIWPPAWNTECSIDLRVGGVFSVAAAEQGLSVEGRYVEIEPMTRLVLTWRWGDDPEESLLTITIQPSDVGTELVLTHDRFDDETSRANHEQGWNDCLDRLPAYFAAAAPAAPASPGTP